MNVQTTISHRIPELSIIKFKSHKQLSLNEIIELERKFCCKYVEDYKTGLQWEIVMRNNFKRKVDSELQLEPRERYFLREYRVNRMLNFHQLMHFQEQFDGQFVSESDANGHYTVVLKHKRKEIQRPPPPPQNSPAEENLFVRSFLERDYS